MVYGYRKYTSRKQKRDYAIQMQEIEDYFKTSEWRLNLYVPFIEKITENIVFNCGNYFTKYNGDNDKLEVTYKCSKLLFIDYVENHHDKIVTILEKLELTKYKIINITKEYNGYKLRCHLRGFANKKEIFEF